MADNTPYLIINPAADNYKLAKKLDKVLKIAKDVFGDFEYKYTEKIGDGIPYAKQAIKDGYKRLVAVGGDGTLNELINAAVKTDVALGMVPGGSACDTHKTHGIPRDFERAFEIVNEGYYERFPVGHAKGDTGRYFVEMMNGAFVGESAARLGDTYQWAHSEFTYAAVAAYICIFKYKPAPVRITVDNREVREVNLSAFAVSLTDTVSDFEFIPGHHPRSGNLAVFISKDIKGLKLFRLMIKALNGRHMPNKYSEILYGKHVLIESEEPHTYEIEGEIPSVKSKRMECTYIPDAVNLIIPKGWKYEKSKKERNKAKKRVLRGLPPFSE
ncbi:MAG: diacylglycerol/lipid kinase family protein [Candidatus Heimdallarchaeota archaeon]